MARERAVGEVEQREAREQRRRLAEHDVAGWLPAPHLRIVHAGQVVEDERRGVHELGRERHAQGALLTAADIGAEQGERRTDPLGPRE